MSTTIVDAKLWKHPISLTLPCAWDFFCRTWSCGVGLATCLCVHLARYIARLAFFENVNYNGL